MVDMLDTPIPVTWSMKQRDKVVVMIGKRIMEQKEKSEQDEAKDLGWMLCMV
jgi:hypothetical protein